MYFFRFTTWWVLVLSDHFHYNDPTYINRIDHRKGFIENNVEAHKFYYSPNYNKLYAHHHLYETFEMYFFRFTAWRVLVLSDNFNFNDPSCINRYDHQKRFFSYNVEANDK